MSKFEKFFKSAPIYILTTANSDTMENKNTEDSFITINSIKKPEGKHLLVNGQINFRSKYGHLKPKLHFLSQKKLIDIALNDGSWQIRRLVLKYIKNPDTVYTIASKDKSYRVRVYFLKNFKQANLKQIALADPCSKVREQAIKYISDYHLLKYITLNDSSTAVMLKAAKKINDEEILKEFINSNIDTVAIIDIIKKIDDEKFLFDLFRKTDLEKIKLEIIENLTNQEYILGLYKQSNYYFRIKLISKLDVDDDSLLKAFEHEQKLELKELILNKFKAKESFEQIFLMDDAHHFSQICIENIHNQNLLLKAIYEDYDMPTKLKGIRNLNQKNSFEIYKDLSLNYDLRLKALQNIKKEKYLIEICENTRDICVILTALSGIRNQEFIKGFGLKHDNWKVRSLAIAKTNDENLLVDVALNETCWFSRKLAAEKIHDDEKLVKILIGEENHLIQKSITSSIENPEILLELFKAGHVNHIDLDVIEKFKDNEEIVTYIALNHELKQYRQEAVKQIENEETLRRIVLNDESFDVQSLALVECDGEYKKSKRKYRFNPALRFTDEDIFYEYIMKNDKEQHSGFFISIANELINNIQSPYYLKDITLNTGNYNIFDYAINSDNFDMNCIGEDEILERISHFAEDFHNPSEKLLAKIKDERKILDFILKYSKDALPISISMVGHITNEEYLYKLANSNHLELSIKTLAVEQISNQEMLEEIVLNHPNEFVRNQAIKNIENMDLIKNVALYDPSQFVRKSAILWNGYEKSSGYYGVGYDKVGNAKIIVSNEKILEEIVLKSFDKKIRYAALKMIQNEEILSRIAIKSGDVEIRNKAVQSIQDQDILMNIALNDPSRIVRTSTINSIDEANLIKIVILLDDWYIRDYALKQIADESTINDFAFNDSNWHVRHTAVMKIDDDTILKDIALRDTNINIRKSAIEKITDNDILNDILAKTTHLTTPNFIKERLRGCEYESN